jgi:hypothetical protein
VNRTEYTILTEEETIEVLNGTALVNQDDHTLIYGYDQDRNSFHVYLENKVIFIVCYNNVLEVLYYKDETIVQSNSEYIPDKRIYPQYCDGEFCMKLKKSGIYLPFTNFNENYVEETFYGYRFCDLKLY